MSAASTAARGRRAAERNMQDTFIAYAATTATTDGIEEDVWEPQFTSPGKVAGSSMQARDTNTRMVSVGGIERPVVEGGLHIPLSAPLPAIGWEFECVGVGPASDPSLLGRRWRVVDVPAKSYATARRLDVVEVPQ